MTLGIVGTKQGMTRIFHGGRAVGAGNGGCRPRQTESRR